MDPDVIRARVEAFPRWHYAFDLRGVRTPIHDERKVVRHRERRPYLFDPLLRLCGGSLEGKRVLDLGCNAGFWSLCAIEAGCDYVLGVDGRQMHVEQAELVFEVREVEQRRYDFRRADVFALDPREIGSFDVVLCLGLLYHVNSPVTLMQIMDACCEDVLLLDTLLTIHEGSVFDLRRESAESPRNTLEDGLVLVPSRDAVLDLVGRFGYDVRELEPHFTSYRGARDYQIGRRRGFLCAKRSRQALLD